MLGYVLLCYSLVLCMICSGCAQEPQSCSMVDIMEKLLNKMVRMEIKLERFEKTLNEEVVKRGMQADQPCAPATCENRNIAFRAFLSHKVTNTSPEMIIKFDQVDLNLGGAYDQTCGIFTAPVNGTYLFSMAIGNPTGKPGTFFMKKNGVGLEYAFAGHTSGWNMGGVTTVAQLVTGDKVWVVAEGHAFATGPIERYHTGFSGVLINASN